MTKKLKHLHKLHISPYFIVGLWYNKPTINLLQEVHLMATADKKITHTAAEVAEFIRPLSQSVEALQ